MCVPSKRHILFVSWESVNSFFFLHVKLNEEGIRKGFEHKTNKKLFEFFDSLLDFGFSFSLSLRFCFLTFFFFFSCICYLLIIGFLFSRSSTCVYVPSKFILEMNLLFLLVQYPWPKKQRKQKQQNIFRSVCLLRFTLFFNFHFFSS
jgi:hypothetical protein